DPGTAWETAVLPAALLLAALLAAVRVPWRSVDAFVAGCSAGPLLHLPPTAASVRAWVCAAAAYVTRSFFAARPAGGSGGWTPRPGRAPRFRRSRRSARASPSAGRLCAAAPSSERSARGHPPGSNRVRVSSCRAQPTTGAVVRVAPASAAKTPPKRRLGQDLARGPQVLPSSGLEACGVS